MKKTISGIALLLFTGVLTFADINVPFFGGNNFTMDVDTTFTADMNDGSTGLLTQAGFGLWFEFTPYGDRNITPQRDVMSVSLKLANSAFYAWRGYGIINDGLLNDKDQTPSDLGANGDQAKSIWFDTFIAQLEYNQWWVRIAGIEPEISISQASIRSVFDPIIANRTDISKNRLPFPLFVGDPNHYNGNGGVVGLMGRDIVHLNRREVVISGLLSAGMTTEILDVRVKAGSWMKGEDNTENAWIGGVDLAWRPDLAQSINFSFLTALNYGTVTMDKNDPMADQNALRENPIALGIGYDYRFNLPGRMVLRPYAGFDFLYEVESGDYNFEIGGGIQLYFRGTNASLKRNTKIGGIQLGDVAIPAAFIIGVNVDSFSLVNAVISFNEDPRSSLIPNLGGYLQVELMNIGGKNYLAPDGNEYSDFLWAGIVQIEYLISPKIMPYIFGKYIPGELIGDRTVYSKDTTSLTAKLGCRFTPFNFFSVDIWYERTDIRRGDDWTADDGAVSIMFAVWNYL